MRFGIIKGEFNGTVRFNFDVSWLKVVYSVCNELVSVE